MSILSINGRLEDQNQEQLLAIARRLLVEADALSTRIAAVNEIGVAINRTLDLSEIQRVVAKQAKWLLDFEYFSVCLPDDDSAGAWRCATLFGHAEDGSLSLIDMDNVGAVLRTGQSRLLHTGSDSPFMAAYQSQLIVPLVADHVVMGTINFATRRARAFTQADMRIAYMLALQLSSAIRNARTFAELRRTQDELQRHADALEARNQELDAYSYTIAHDLKLPLSSMILKSDLTLRRYSDSIPAPVIEALEGVKERGRKMGEMIDQLLWLARLRDFEKAIALVDMDEVVTGALVRLRPLIDERGIVLDIQPDLPAALGHTLALEEVLANLISNAVKYMGSTTAPRIVVRGEQQGAFARYSVQDNGVGILPEDQARLFAMFTRLHTVRAEGLGLGLSIVDRIVSRLNGSVGVDSTPGQGSTFWFTLPAASDSASARGEMYTLAQP